MNRYRLMLLGIILLGFGLRVWNLPALPPGLWYDEAYNALDARWLAEQDTFVPFLVGNNGREAMWHYLVLLSTTLWGNTSFAVRWVGSLAGVITISVIYRFAGALLAPFARSHRDRRWLALAAIGWLAVSWWHLLNSRDGLRLILLPPLLMASLYFFWQGCKEQGVGSKEYGVRSKETRRQGGKESTVASDPSRFTLYVSRFQPFILSGLFLGLSQYTYLPARLAPLIFAGLGVVWSGQSLWSKISPPSPPEGGASEPIPPFGEIAGSEVTPPHLPSTIYRLPQLWLGLFVTGLVAGLVFLPLGLFFLHNPDTFFSRTGDVGIAPTTFGELVVHLGQALTLFLGASHELYRHHLPGRAMLGWLEIPFFWLGLLFLLRPAQLRRPATQLILLSLLVMWLPALLASPPVHSLRPIGLLPFYYLIVTVGLYCVVRSAYSVKFKTHYALRTTQSVFPALVITILLISTVINTYDYFWRWANHPEVYKEFNGPLADLTADLIERTKNHDVLIPLHVYVHPTTRYFLGDAFPEKMGVAPPLERPLEMLLVPSAFQLLYVGNIPESPALVLLTRDAAGQGAVYVSRPPRSAEQTTLNEMLTDLQPQPFEDRLGRAVAQFVTLDDKGDPLTIQNRKSKIQNLFNPAPLRTIALTWPGQAQLTGYDVTPNPVAPGQPLTLNLYWRSLTDRAFEDKLFLQVIDSTGQPLSQKEEDAFREDMYRWRPDGLLPTQHTLWLGPETPLGAYLIRLGFFDPATGERLALSGGAGEPFDFAQDRQGSGGAGETAVDQVQLGLFYVTPDSSEPAEPATLLSATFGDFLQLIGVTIPNLPGKAPQSPREASNLQLPITFHWTALQPTDRPYTVFLQLLDAQGQVVSSWDSQPFNGLYPTNLWSPGETITDTFTLPLPGEGLPPGDYRLITGFYDVTTGQRLPVAGGGDFVELAVFGVE